ncbi:MAG: hypothetical protein DBY04_08695 [Clostridiales bacterium]|nr:MAG: hypothetical protein DBY04_08695 [Clostridiales bacterium]
MPARRAALRQKFLRIFFLLVAFRSLVRRCRRAPPFFADKCRRAGGTIENPQKISEEFFREAFLILWVSDVKKGACFFP